MTGIQIYNTVFLDKEDGESLKDLLIRKIKAHKAHKVAKQ